MLVANVETPLFLSMSFTIILAVSFGYLFLRFVQYLEDKNWETCVIASATVLVLTFMFFATILQIKL